jgi:DNA-binding response OmpR family regulator
VHYKNGDESLMGKILIIDDDEEHILKPLVRQLSRVFGTENVEGVADAKTAILFAEGVNVDVVVTDVMMLGMDGFEFCRSFRSNPLNLGYIIILSGRDGGIAEGLHSCADVCFRKPYDIADLAAQIKNGLEVAQNRQNPIVDSKTYFRHSFQAGVRKAQR